MPPAGFETTISAGERPQTYALDRAATGTETTTTTTTTTTTNNNNNNNSSMFSFYSIRLLLETQACIRAFRTAMS